MNSAIPTIFLFLKKTFFLFCCASFWLVSKNIPCGIVLGLNFTFISSLFFCFVFVCLFFWSILAPFIPLFSFFTFIVSFFSSWSTFCLIFCHSLPLLHSFIQLFLLNNQTKTTDKIPLAIQAGKFSLRTDEEGGVVSSVTCHSFPVAMFFLHLPLLLLLLYIISLTQIFIAWAIKTILNSHSDFFSLFFFGISFSCLLQ